MYRFLVTALLLIVLFPVRAEPLTGTFGSEYFSWREYDGDDLLLEESGLRHFVGLEAESMSASNWGYGLRGRLYLGRVAYDGQTQAGVPHTSDTDYLGWSAELDFTHRFLFSPTASHAWAVTLSVGYDSWLRSLRDKGGIYGYDEDYEVGYGRLGAVYSGNHGWAVQGGVKLPFYTSESVDLTRLGFDNDPTLRPKPDYSLYASISYRLSPGWDIGGYYDSYRFRQSDEVRVTRSGELWSFHQPKSRQDSIGFYLNLHF